MPFFSIIMPAYNRAGLIGRAIRSCLVQDFEDFEIVITDDASTDGTAGAVESIRDGRIRLLRHAANRGRCPSRNTAMREARGAWFVFLDSDDELTPGGLSAIYARAVSVRLDVGGLRFMCRDEHGRVSPDPPHRNEIWGYAEYLHFMEAHCAWNGEALPCARRETFPAVRYPEGHAEECLYHLNLAKSFRVGAYSDIVRSYHHDATNQITTPNWRRSLQYASDAAENVRAVLDGHGSVLREHAPNVYSQKLLEGAVCNFLWGKRRSGLRFVRSYVRNRPFSVRPYVVALVGLVSGRCLARLQGSRWRAQPGDRKRSCEYGR